MAKSRTQKILTDFVLLVITMLIVSLIFWFSNLDIRLARLFYSQSEGWFLADHWLFTWMYEFGPYPALVSFFSAIALLLLSFFLKALKKHCKSLIFIILFLIIGSGLIVNFLFKDNWGRPRPRDITEFGGQYEFTHHWLFGPIDKNSSFPSGHVSIAFFMIFFYFINKRKRFLLTCMPGLVYGMIMIFTRMAQGAHFASDGIYSGFFMYLTGLFLYYALGMDIIKDS